MVIEHSQPFTHNIDMNLLHYLKIDGKWYRALCDNCLTPIQNIHQKHCNFCRPRVKPVNFIHNKPHTKETKDKLRAINTKTELGYHGIHNWLRREYGVATECRNKLCQGRSTKYNWANITGVYKKDISHYTQLCASCHVSHDRWGHEIQL